MGVSYFEKDEADVKTGRDMIEANQAVDNVLYDSVAQSTCCLFSDWKALT